MASLDDLALVAPVATLSPSSLVGAGGGTAQLTLLRYDWSSSPSIAWSTSDASIATVNSSGLVTYVGAGTATITATSGGYSASVSVTVTASEISFLRSNIVGGDSTILAIYSALSSAMTTDGSGNITVMPDARGAGFLGNLTPQGANGPHLTGADPNTRTIDLSAGHTLMSALTASLDLSPGHAYTIAIISTQKGGNQGATASIGQADFSILFGDDYHLLPGWIQGTARDATGFQAFGDAGESSNSRNYSTRLRLHVYDISGTAVRITPYAYEAQTATVRAFSSGSQRFLLGFDSSIPTVQSVRGVVILNRQRTSGDLTTFLNWRSYHPGMVTGGPNFMAFEGDSLTSGLIIGYNNRWPAQMLEMAGFEVVDDVNRAISQSLINSTFFGSALNISNATRRALVTSKYDATRTKNIYVLLAGRNNLAIVPETGATVAASILAEADYRRAEGWKVILCTVFDTAKLGGEAVANQATLDTERAALNSALIAGWASHADALVQLHTTTNLTDRTNATYFNADQVHLTTAGQTVIANAVKVAALALLV